MAAVAALVGDPARANMLAAMLDGRAHTATELAQLAGIAAPTASGHLAKLSRAQLIGVVAQGRHRYYRLASAEIGRMLEGIMVVAGELAPTTRRATPRIDPALRRARTCYDHIAGELGVAIADGLVQLGVVDLTIDGAAVTETGRAALPLLESSLTDHVVANGSIAVHAWTGVSAGRISPACSVPRCSSERWRSAWSADETTAACSTSPAVKTRMHCIGLALMVRRVGLLLLSRPDPAFRPVTSGPAALLRAGSCCSWAARPRRDTVTQGNTAPLPNKTEAGKAKGVSLSGGDAT